MLELLPAYRLDERLAAITCPVLLAMGASDFLVPPSLWEAGTRPPRTTVEIFERSGHTPFVEEVEVFERRLLDWLARASIP